MGGDFTYQDAFMWFDNMDRLIKHANLKAAKEGLNLKLFYSTPQCYLKAVKDANPTLPTKQDDFFPYASDSTAFWTGYFTSRPTTKLMEREGNNFLQTFKMLQVLATLPKTNMFVLNELKSAMGVMQHHDAITGTEKQHVTHDYERIMSQAVEDAFIIASQAFNKVTKSEVTLSYERCQFNQSQCSVTEESESFIVTVFNNQASFKTSVNVDLPVTNTDGNSAFTVYDDDGKEVPSELSPLLPEYFNIPTRKSLATHSLYFLINSIPGLGFKSYYVKKERKITREQRNTKRLYDYYTDMNDYWKDVRDRADGDIKNVEDSYTPKVEMFFDTRNTINTVDRDYDKNLNWDVMRDGKMMKDDEIKHIINEANRKLIEDSLRAVKKERKVVFPALNDDEMRMLSDDPGVVEEPHDIVLENEFITLTIDKRTGWMNYSSKSDGTTISYLPQPGYYIGCEGDNRVPANRSSGAYIFRPNMTATPELKTFDNFEIVKVTQTDLRQEVIIKYDESVTLKIGINSNVTYISSIIHIDEGREYVLRFKTNLKTNGVFYTDSNGRQMLKRLRNKRPQWNLTLAEPIPGNYYPVVSEIYVEDDNVRMILNVDRARGGSSLKDGSFEIMQHRRLKHDDAFGVGEALNETASGIGLYSIDNVILQIVPKTKENLVKAAVISHKFFSPPQIFVANANGLTLDNFKTMINVYSFLRNELPIGVELLTLEPWSDGKILIRLENYLDSSLSPDAVAVDIARLFKTIEISSIKETTLAANRWLSDYKRWEWNTENEFSNSFNEDYGNEAEKTAGVTPKKQNAKQIRTFIASLKVVK